MPSARPSLFVTLAVASLALASPTPIEERSSDNSSVSCIPYIPEGWKNNTAKINFDNADDYEFCPAYRLPYGSYNRTTLPANATNPKLAGHFILANHKLSTGTKYSFSACTIPTLNLTSPQTNGGAFFSHGYEFTYNFVRVETHSPLYGGQRRCLTTDNRNLTTSTLSFRECQTHPTTRSQFFLATQGKYALYDGGGFGTPFPCGPVWIENLRDHNEIPDHTPFNLGNPPPGDDGKYYMWGLSERDNRTIETIHYDSFSNGLLASLVEV